MSRHRLTATTTTVVPPPRDSVQHLARWAAAACPRGARVLSVGAGGDVSGSLGPLLRRSPHLVGVDPDRAVRSNRSLTEWHQMTLEEFAAGTSDRFDLGTLPDRLPLQLGAGDPPALLVGRVLTLDFRCTTPPRTSGTSRTG